MEIPPCCGVVVGIAELSPEAGVTGVFSIDGEGFTDGAGCVPGPVQPAQRIAHIAIRHSRMMHDLMQMY